MRDITFLHSIFILSDPYTYILLWFVDCRGKIIHLRPEIWVAEGRNLGLIKKLFPRGWIARNLSFIEHHRSTVAVEQSHAQK